VPRKRIRQILGEALLLTIKRRTNGQTQSQVVVYHR
jgi:hypothetical protein